MSNSPLVYMLAGIAKFLHCSDDDSLELVTPDRVQLVDLLVLLNGELSQVANEGLSGFRVLFGLEAVVFNLLLSIFF